MDVTIPNEMAPTVVGASLALAGGLLTQFLFLWFSRRHTCKVLLIALKAEIGIVRENLRSSINGICSIGGADDKTPRPDVFLLPTPVFDANAEHLGKIQDTDLVEHIVEVYASIYELRDRSQHFSQFPNEGLNERAVAEILLYAIPLYVQVAKLHSRLAEKIRSKALPAPKGEAKINTLFEFMRKKLEEERITELLETKWWRA